jgi:hypothetical protein
MRSLLAALLLVVLVPLAATADTPKPLFLGKDLTGWKTKAGESLEGKTEAFGGRFKVVGDALMLDPAVKGDVVIETAESFAGDVRVMFEFKPDAKCNNDLFFRGVKFDIKQSDVKNMKVGEWNTFEIITKGNQVEFRANGELVRSAAAKNAASGLGVRAEFGAMEIRKVGVIAVK